MFGIGGLLGGVSGGVSPSASSSASLTTGPVDTTQQSDFVFSSGGGSSQARNGSAGVSPLTLAIAAGGFVAGWLLYAVMRK